MAAPVEVVSAEIERTKTSETAMQQSSTDAKSIIEKAKSCQKHDAYAAKSLLLMAKTLYPSEFCVQFEAFIVEKGGQNPSELAQSLISLFSDFSHEERLREELFLVTTALQNEDNNEFYNELFDAIPEYYQRKILMFCAMICTDKYNRCKLQLLLMKKFPDFIQEYGISLLDSLLELDKTVGAGNPCNKFRQLLVTEVLPVILRCDHLKFSSKQLWKQLMLSIEFYITVAIQARNPRTTSDSVLKSPTGGHPSLGKSEGDQGMGTAGHLEGESGMRSITSPWERLTELLVMVASKSSWNQDCIPPSTLYCECLLPLSSLANLIAVYASPMCLLTLGSQEADTLMTLPRGYEESFASLYSTFHTCHQEDLPTLKSVFYSTVILLFKSMYSYITAMNPAIFGGNSTSTGVSLPHSILIEDLESKKKSRKHKHKKRKIEGGKEVVIEGDGSEDPSLLAPPILPDEDAVGVGDDVIRAFTTSINCWQIINQNETFTRDFYQLRHRLKSDDWPWVRLFQIDMHIYRGEYTQALAVLQDERSRQSHNTKLKIHLSFQQASCQFTIGQHTVAAESILKVLPLCDQLFASGGFPRGKKMQTAHCPKHGRLLHIVPFKMEALLPYSIQLIYMSFKKRVFLYADAGDTSLGHMITLIQYDWPREQSTFAEILKQLTKAGSFSYPVFFTYIINLDFLEEFAYLVTPNAGSIQLDLFPPCITIQRQQRTITRGITRGGKEDFRTTVEKQVMRCGENISGLIFKFLVTERDSLLQCLHAHTTSV